MTLSQPRVPIKNNCTLPQFISFEVKYQAKLKSDSIGANFIGMTQTILMQWYLID